MRTRRDGPKSFMIHIAGSSELSSVRRIIETSRKEDTVKCDLRDDIPNSTSVGESSILSFDESLRLIYSTREKFPNGIHGCYNI